MWEAQTHLLGDGTVMVECGPMRLFIEGSLHGEPRTDDCLEAGRRAVTALEEIAAQRHVVWKPAREIPEPPLQLVIHAMWEAARAVAAEDLTPMAAVAGTIADLVADSLRDRGLTRVVVNNGGDIAFRLGPGEALSVGIRPDVTDELVTHRISLDHAASVGGICTSGFGGRSFTRGMASAATVLAKRAGIADAAATTIANAAFVDSTAVTRALAETIDPDTDIKGLLVTTAIGDLTPRERDAAIAAGIERAEGLASRGLILGACVAVKGHLRSTSSLAGMIKKL